MYKSRLYVIIGTNVRTKSDVHCAKEKLDDSALIMLTQPKEKEKL